MGQLRILIVDDEEDLISTLAERLELRGFEVEAITDGSKALKRVNEGDFDVLVLDVKMPGIDGLELMAQIKEKHPDLPVIMFTGHGSMASARKGIIRGATDYLMKPVDIENLIKKIRDAAARKKNKKP